MKVIDSHDFVQAHANGFVLDVRTPAEFGGVHVMGALNLPLTDVRRGKFESWIAQMGWQPGRTIYVLCKSGQRARMAVEKLAGLNLDLCVVEGGTDACIAAGLPVSIGAKAVMSLERQVRIVAGSLVVLGVLLGWLVAPAFYVLSGFVGAGLAFAGVTDTCAMGLLLSRMPWNRKSQEMASCCSASAR